MQNASNIITPEQAQLLVNLLSNMVQPVQQQPTPATKADIKAFYRKQISKRFNQKYIFQQ
jgi:mono/diheme cytochrome c family protein